MTDTHTFYWLVGVCEGEAYFGLDSGVTPVIQIEMKDEHVIARLAAIFGISYMRRDRRHARPRVSVTYRVVLKGRRAMRLMKRLQPYMSPRRARAIQRVEDGYIALGSRASQDYARVALPSLTEVPYTATA
jgi:hypothetical protein